MSTEEDLGKEDSTSSDRRAYMHSIRYNQKTTPCIKWREKLRETQLAVRASRRLHPLQKRAVILKNRAQAYVRTYDRVQYTLLK
jgi:hypothetical protein